MKCAFTIVTSLLLFFGNISHSQNTTCLKEINNQIWANFTKAFEVLDVNLFESLHSENLIRVNGDNKNVRNKISYINGYKNRWKNNKINQTISFRFLERICSNNKASERGIYKLTRNPNTENEQSYYGKFHVILIKEDGVWKILVDYDYSEQKNIDESTFITAFEIDDFEKY